MKTPFKLPFTPGLRRRVSRRGALLTIAGGAVALTGLPPAPARAATPGLTRIAERLSEPWAFAFLPDGRILITERRGRLWLVSDTGRRAVDGVPQVADVGQGGLLDILLPRDFARTRQVFLTFARQQGDGAGTALGVGRLSLDSDRLEGFKVIFEAVAGARGGRHFGARAAELPDGTLAMTLGDRGDDGLAQDLSRQEGKVIRINRDGSVPADNPFVGQTGVRPEIFSYGHRNPQGLAVDGSGQLWASEHGARGGDEVNAIRRGANFGWPVISYGRHYSGARIGIGTAAPGMEQPAHVWDPSIAPSGHLIHSGRMFPDWQGRHLIGSLKLDHIAVLTPGPAQWQETKLELPETARVRDLREGPDGAVWFLSVDRGALFRLAR